MGKTDIFCLIAIAMFAEKMLDVFFPYQGWTKNTTPNNKSVSQNKELPVSTVFPSEGLPPDLQSLGAPRSARGYLRSDAPKIKNVAKMLV